VLIDLGLGPRLADRVISPDAISIMSAQRGGEIARLPLGLLALFAANQRLKPRPDLAGLFFPPLFLVLLDRLGAAGATRGRRALWLGVLALLQALWTNLHGSFVLGPLLVGVIVAAIGLSLGGPTGYAINPARDLGPRIAHAVLPIAGKGSSDWGYAWIPVVGPIVGGVLAALQNNQLGLIDNWLRHVQDVRAKHGSQIDSLANEMEQHARLCELNVIEQVANVSQTTIARDAWARNQPLAVHGWIYDLSDGLLRDMEVTVTSEARSMPRQII